MPDGKAQALLHVLGRRTGLPTLIAKKEQKPYMAEPVLKGVRANCMTSVRRCVRAAGFGACRRQTRTSCAPAARPPV